jgi:hypothetical protein
MSDGVAVHAESTGHTNENRNYISPDLQPGPRPVLLLFHQHTMTLLLLSPRSC